MVINTLKHNYYVINKLTDNKVFEALLCYEAGKPDGQIDSPTDRYRVCRLKSKELTYRLISVFMELKKHTEFADFYDCFSKDGCLYLVFKQYDYPMLTDKLDKERCDLMERLIIGKNLLEHILMLDMPDFILYDALAPDCVTVSATLEIFFNYNLVSIEQYETLGISEVKRQLTVLYKHLFAYELKKEASVDIEEFIIGLQELEYKNYIEIYKKYDVLYEKLSKGNLIAKIKPNTFIFRLWDRIKGLGKYVKPILSVLLVLLIAGYLIYTIIHKPVDAATVYNFDKIGTVTIRVDAPK